MKHYYTALIEYDRSEDMPRVHAGMEALGGKVIAVHFDDMFKELERFEDEWRVAHLQPTPPKYGCPACRIRASGRATGYVCARGDCPTRGYLRGCRMTPSERIATAVIAACMIGFIALLVWAAL